MFFCRFHPAVQLNSCYFLWAVSKMIRARLPRLYASTAIEKIIRVAPGITKLAVIRIKFIS